MKSVRIQRAALAATVGLALLGGGAAQADSLNFAAGFRWQGYVATSLPMSSFYSSDHSVVLKFMAQYPGAYQGPMFTTSVDGNYLIGIGDFSEGTNKVKLQVTFGGNTAYFSGQNVGSDVKPGKWNSLVVVKESGAYRVWLNAQLLSRDSCSGSGCTSLAEGGTAVTGNVRLGRKGNGNAQFYGMLDDVEVYDRALSGFEVWLVSGLTRLSGNESGVLRAWTFDSAMPNGDPNPPTVHSGTFVAPAYKVLVSAARDGAFDELSLPRPTVTVDLPFAKNVQWKVIQDFATTTGPSHFGNAAFSWDFVRNTSNNDDTCGAKLVAAATGTLFHGWDWGGDLDPDDDLENPIDGYNDLKLELATEGEYLRYLHVLTGSIRGAFSLSDLPENIPAFGVTKGTKVAEAGTRGPDNCHLHLSYSNGTVTIPLGYNYERWVPTNGGYWTAITNGMPKQDEVIRRP